jgi:DNA-binding NarL/FixJ family response regulator
VAIKKHVFISTSGELLPRWKQAFSKAAIASPGAPLPQADYIWLRLQSGVPVAQQIQPVRALANGSALIILSDLPNDDEATVAFSLAVNGYANTHASAETLKQIAKVVEQGGLWIGVSLMQRLLGGINHLPPVAKASTQATLQHKLTDRELEVAKAIASGASNKEVARQLQITERTVKAHVSGLFTKLNVNDRLQLALKMREITG